MIEVFMNLSLVYEIIKNRQIIIVISNVVLKSFRLILFKNKLKKADMLLIRLLIST